MTTPRSLVHLLRNVTARELIRALERDGFYLSRRIRGSGRVYEHQDGRTTLLHYHGPNQTFPRGTLANILRGTRWTVEDARRLGLI